MTTQRLHLFIEHLRTSFDGSGLSDAELVERFVAHRDEAAFEVLVWRHGALVLGLGQRLLHRVEDAEDVFQATFLTLARKAGAIVRREALAGWLYKTAYRLALRLRVRRSRGGPESRLPDDLPGREQGAPEDKGELAAAVHEEVNRLPEKYRLPVVLHYLEGVSTAEAARQLGWPRGTVCTRLAEARQRLHRRLVRRGLAPAAAGLTATLAATAAAAVPPVLAVSTARAAVQTATGQTVPALVSARVAALMEEGKCGLRLTSLPWVVLLLAVAGLGVGIWGWAADHPFAEGEEMPPIGDVRQEVVPPAQKQGVVLPAGKEPLVLKVEQPLAVTFSSDGRWLAVASGRTVLVYEAATFRRVHELKGHEKMVLSLAFSRDGRYLASGSMDYTVKIWDCASGKNVQTLKDHPLDVAALAFSADGKHLVAVTGRHWWMAIPKAAAVKVWEVDSGRAVRTVAIPAYLGSDIAVSRDGQFVAGINLDGAAEVREVNTGRLIREFLGRKNLPPGQKESDDRRRAAGVAFSPDGKSLATCDDLGELTLWNFRNGQKILSRQEPIRIGFGLRGLESQRAFSADGKQLALARHWHFEGPEARVQDQQDLLVWNLTVKTKPISLPVTATVIALAFDPDGQRLAAAQSDATLRIWRLPKKQ